MVKGTDTEMAGHYEFEDRISQFRNVNTNVLYLYRRHAKYLSFLPTDEPISHYCLSDQHSYTHGPLTDTSVWNS